MRQERGKTNGEPLKRIVHPSDFSQSSRVAFCHASKSPSSPTQIRRLSSSRERPLESLAPPCKTSAGFAVARNAPARGPESLAS